MNAHSLPEPFRMLEPHMSWALGTERERMAKRQSTPMPAIIEFHDAMLGRLEAIIGYLNQYPYAEMPEDARSLCNMALSLVEISALVEMYKDPDALKMVGPERFVPYE